MKYIKVYRALLSINLSNILIYRSNFINSLISTLSWGVFSILSMILLTSKTKQVFTWSREEIILLTTSYSIFIGIFHMIFSRNFEKIPEIIDRGQLDLILTKPLNSQFLITTKYIGFISLSRVILGIVAFIYFLQKFSIVIMWYQVPIYIIFSIIGFIILYDIWLLVMTLSFWFTRLTNLAELMFSISNMSRFPPEIFKESLGFIFLFLLPLTVIIVSPIKSLLGNLSLYDFLVPIISVIILTIISRKFWLYGLKNYTSAGG